MSKGIQTALGILFAAAMAANVVWAVRSMHKAEEKPEEKHEEPKRLSHDEAGNAVLKLDKETQERGALQVEELKEATLPAELVAYGRFVEDPSSSFTLRAPVAGILRKAAERAWPVLGEMIGDGIAVGILQPRFSPLERVDLQGRLTTAQAEIAAATASVEAAKASVERLKLLNADNKTASDRQLQEAYAKATAESARLKAATETVAAIEASLGARAGATGPMALTVDRRGEVVELLARPGEAVESGQPLLRVALYDRLLARASLPAGGLAPAAAQAATARILPLGREPLVLKGERAGTAEPQLLGDAVHYAVDAAEARLRPGMAFTAYLPLPGESAKGVVLPRGAILRLEGERWVWIQTADNQFTRREVEHARPVDAGWFVSEGFKPGEKIVVAGAALLLSEELKSKFQETE